MWESFWEREYNNSSSIEWWNDVSQEWTTLENNSSENEKSTENPEKISHYLLSKSVKDITFGYKKSLNKNPKFISNLKEKYEWNESSEWLVANHDQIQTLLSELRSEYWEYIWSDKEKLKKQINEWKLWDQWTDKTQMIESYNEYLFNNDTEEWFEEFLTTSKCINDVITVYLEDHIDSNWKINFISKNDLKAKIKAAWKEKLYSDYISDKQGVEYQELLKLNSMGALIKHRIDSIIFQYLDGGWHKWWNEELTNKLTELLEAVRSNDNTEKIKEKYDSDKINLMLRTSIREYSRLLNLSEKNRKLVTTNDAVFDLHLRSYLFLYGKIFYPDIFKDNKWFADKKEEEKLWELLEAILVADWDLKKLRDTKFTKREEELRKEQQERERLKRKEAWERMVYNMKPDSWNSEKENGDIESKSIDIQNASWVEIARAGNLWQWLKKFEINEEISDTDRRFIQKIALEKAWKQFILENKWILSTYIDNWAELIKLFDVNKWIELNPRKWEEFVNSWTRNNPESNIMGLEELHSVLLSFRNKFNENVNELNDNFQTKKDDLHETVKDFAIGAVIDDVKDMFWKIVNSNNTWIYMSWFEFDEKESAQIRNDNLIISGKFNGEKLSLKYNLNSGDLYMNAFIDNNGQTIVVWSQEPTHKIWSLQPFENILDDFYKNPTDSISDDIFTKFANTSIPQPNNWPNTSAQDRLPQKHIDKKKMRERMKEEHRLKIQKICWTKLDEIWLNIKNEVETKSNQYHTISSLLQTLNVIPENTNNNTINLINGSDLYSVVQLVTNSENTDIIHFANYMQKLMNQIWLTWWKNNEHQDKTKEISKIIFDENYTQEYISYVRGLSQNFYNECSIAKGKAQFDGTVNFWILKIIEEKFTNGDFPNWKLDSHKIEDFEKHLTNEISDAKNLADVEKKLESQDVWELSINW